MSGTLLSPPFCLHLTDRAQNFVNVVVNVLSYLTWYAWLGWYVGFSGFHQSGCCKPVSGHTVRDENGRVPATMQGPLNTEMASLFLVLVHLGRPKKGCKTVIVVSQPLSLNHVISHNFGKYWRIFKILSPMMIFVVHITRRISLSKALCNISIACCTGNHEFIFFMRTFGTIEVVINSMKLATFISKTSCLLPYFLHHPVINHSLILFNGYFCQQKQYLTATVISYN